MEYTDPLKAAKDALQSAIDNAPDVPGDAEGDGYFQFSETNISNYTQAKTLAQTAHDAIDATEASLLAAKVALEEAIENASNNKDKLFNTFYLCLLCNLNCKVCVDLVVLFFRSIVNISNIS